MDDKKYQIFVSSTYNDLFNARKKVIEAILSIYHFPVGMEMFSADDSEQWEIIKETIDASDYYIVIIGHRYGALSNDGVSYTEREYRYAKEIGLPVLAFIRSRRIALTDDEREIDPKLQKKLEKFILLAKDSKMCDFWETPDELVTKVAIALPKIFKRNPRIGWVRGSEAISKEISQELAKLSNENRELREKISVLEENLVEDTPELLVNLSDNECLNLTISSDFEPVTMPERLQYEDIPGEHIGSVSHEAIERYNKKLPSDNELEQHNKKARFYHRVNNDSLKITPKIKNIGRMSASNVRIEMVFPDFVMPFDCYDARRLAEPENIIPSNPIKTMTSLMGVKNYLGGISSSFQIPIEQIKKSKDILSATLDFPVSSINSWVEVNGLAVEAFKNKVMHTKSSTCESFLLVPLKKGSGTVKINIICEEYKEQSSFEVPIVVT